MKRTETHQRVLADARKRFADGERYGLGWTWAQCLRTAYAAERLRRQFDQQREALKPATINWGNQCVNC